MAKEISECYGVFTRVRAILETLDEEKTGGVAPETKKSGEGLTILDVCSGKGLTSILLSYMFPD